MKGVLEAALLAVGELLLQLPAIYNLLDADNLNMLRELHKAVDRVRLSATSWITNVDEQHLAQALVLRDTVDDVAEINARTLVLTEQVLLLELQVRAIHLYLASLCHHAIPAVVDYFHGDAKSHDQRVVVLFLVGFLIFFVRQLLLEQLFVWALANKVLRLHIVASQLQQLLIADNFLG